MTTANPSFAASAIRRAGGPALNVLGVEAHILADGEMTAGRCSMALLRCPHGAGAPPHRHPHTENFHVVNGRLSVLLGDNWHELRAGDFVHVSPGTLHAFRNEQTEPAEFVAVATPSGHEQFFREMDGLATSGSFTMERAIEICRRHHIEVPA